MRMPLRSFMVLHDSTTSHAVRPTIVGIPTIGMTSVGSAAIFLVTILCVRLIILDVLDLTCLEAFEILAFC